MLAPPSQAPAPTAAMTRPGDWTGGAQVGRAGRPAVEFPTAEARPTIAE